MLLRTILREIKSSLGRYLAIFAIIALGVGFFCGLKMCKPDMVDTAERYLDKQNFYDYEILSSYGVDEESEEIALKTPGVADAEVSMQKDIIIDRKIKGKVEESVMKAISIPERINKINLVAGRLPENDNECVVDNYHSIGTEYKIGDTITLSKSNSESDLDTFKSEKYKIVGKVNTPLYLDYERGSTTLGNGTINTFFYINRSAFDADYSTQMYIKLEGNEKSFTDAYESKLDKYEKPVERLAEQVTEARRVTAQAQGQEMLAEKKAEYNAGLIKFNEESAAASSQLNGGMKELVDGINLVNQNDAQLRTTLLDIESKKKMVEDGLAQVESKQKQIDSMRESGEISLVEYLIINEQLKTTRDELNANLNTINDGINQINSALATINEKRKEINSGEKLLRDESDLAKTELSKAKLQLDRAKVALDDAEKQIAEMETGNAYSLSRENNSGYSTYVNNAEIVSNVAKIFPIFFFLVAALVCMTTMTRMVDEQRSQIGALRALGYTNTAIRGMYLIYSGSASLIGSIVGFFIGCRLFPTVIWQAYTMMYDFSSKISILHSWSLGLIVTAVAMLCAMGATWFSCANEFKEVPAELIRPKAPPAGRKIFLEKFTTLWNRLSFMYKVSFRNVFRYKKRFVMMLLGIAGCTALLVAGFGIKTSISGVAERQYGEIMTFDYQLAFNQEMKADDQTKFLEDAKKEIGNYGEAIFLHQGKSKITVNGETRELTMYAVDDANISKFVALKLDGKEIAYPKDGEVVLCRKMQKLYGVKIGDTIKITEGYRKMTAKVSGFCDNYINETMFMTGKTYEQGMEKTPEIRTALVKSSKDATKEDIRKQATQFSNYDTVAVAVVNQDIIEQVESMMKSMNAVVYLIILCAGLLAFIVLYNLTNINILERIREIATIKVLGFFHRETSQYVFRENIILTFISAVVGLPLGRWFLSFVIDNIRIEAMFFMPKITWIDYLLSFVITFVFTYIVNLTLRPRLKNVSMAESLKTIE